MKNIRSKETKKPQVIILISLLYRNAFELYDLVTYFLTELPWQKVWKM